MAYLRALSAPIFRTIVEASVFVSRQGEKKKKRKKKEEEGKGGRVREGGKSCGSVSNASAP